MPYCLRQMLRASAIASSATWIALQVEWMSPAAVTLSSMRRLRTAGSTSIQPHTLQLPSLLPSFERLAGHCQLSWGCMIAYFREYGVEALCRHMQSDMLLS